MFTKPIFSFGRINADEALRLGLVSSVVEPDQLMSHAVTLAQKIARHSHPVVAKAKECVNVAEEVGLTSGLAYERYVRCVLSCKGKRACFCASMLHQAIIINAAMLLYACCIQWVLICVKGIILILMSSIGWM